MIVVLSGEGPTDFGQCTNAQGMCVPPDFSHGPMTLIADKAIAQILGYSVFETTPDRYVYISETKLSELAVERKNHGRRMSLVGKHREQETGHFYINAWMLGEAALTYERELAENDLSIAILFRDADGTRATVKGLWEAKLASMQSGFLRSGLGERGVPMIPKPKSEAWMLCAVKDDAYQHCGKLEGLSGNDSSPKSAKAKLNEALDGHDSAHEQRQWIADNDFDIDAVASQMSSFSQFKNDLGVAVAIVLRETHVAQ